MLLGRNDEAIADATQAQQARPSPAHERLRQRTILAARRFELLQLDQPDELALLPLGGRRLTADLRAAAYGLDQLALARQDETFRASLTLAVILAAQGRNQTAVAAATRALQVSPYSPRGYLIRARVRAFGGDADGAKADIAKGLSIQFNEPGLLELKGVLRAASRRFPRRTRRLQHRERLGCARPNPSSQGVSLGRAGPRRGGGPGMVAGTATRPRASRSLSRSRRAHLKLGHWDMALADLEQAASWAHSDPRIELGIVSAYFQCLGRRTDRLPRFLALAWRAATNLWGAVAIPALPRAPAS